jgi:hypothetical protein
MIRHSGTGIALSTRGVLGLGLREASPWRPRPPSELVGRWRHHRCTNTSTCAVPHACQLVALAPADIRGYRASESRVLGTASRHSAIVVFAAREGARFGNHAANEKSEDAYRPHTAARFTAEQGQLLDLSAALKKRVRIRRLAQAIAHRFRYGTALICFVGGERITRAQRDSEQSCHFRWSLA